MSQPSEKESRLRYALATITLLGALLAGCSGGSAPSVPQTALPLTASPVAAAAATPVMSPEPNGTNAPIVSAPSPAPVLDPSTVSIAKIYTDLITARRHFNLTSEFGAPNRFTATLDIRPGPSSSSRPSQSTFVTDIHIRANGNPYGDLSFTIGYIADAGSLAFTSIAAGQNNTGTDPNPIAIPTAAPASSSGLLFASNLATLRWLVYPTLGNDDSDLIVRTQYSSDPAYQFCLGPQDSSCSGEFDLRYDRKTAAFLGASLVIPGPYLSAITLSGEQQDPAIFPFPSN